MDTENLTSLYIEKKEEKMNQNQNLTINNYPKISNRLIECLERDFPDKLPRKYQDNYELGVLIGQQMVIDKLKAEKVFNEKDVLDEEI
jgi:hypothetical protein